MIKTVQSGIPIGLDNLNTLQIKVPDAVGVEVSHSIFYHIMIYQEPILPEELLLTIFAQALIP